MPVIYNEEKKR